MNEESGAVRDASELERKVSEAAFIIASKNQTAMARRTHRQEGTGTLHNEVARVPD